MSTFGVKRTLTRDTIGIGFLSGYAPRADTNQQISTQRNVTDVISNLPLRERSMAQEETFHEEAQVFDRGDHVRINMGRDRQG